mgnify:CR=1 FL=1
MDTYLIAIAILVVLYFLTATTAHMMGKRDAKKVQEARWNRHVNEAIAITR